MAVGNGVAQNSSTAVDWAVDDSQALMPDSSLHIEDGLISSLQNSQRRGASRGLICALGVLVGVLAVCCICLSAAVVYLARPASFLSTSSSSLQSSTTNWTAANDALNLAGFPLQVDLSRKACSGNGIQYMQQENCTCFECFTGPTCAVAVPLSDCTIAADTGSPLIYEEYWVENPTAEIRIRASDHLGYMTGGPLPRLEAAIRALHTMVGNAVTSGKHIVIGPGSSAVLNGALYGMSTYPNMTGPTQVYAAKPYYSAYPYQTNATNSSLYEWSETAPNASAHNVIEFITAPNNPDGVFRAKTIPGAHGVYDHAYYWPMFSGIPKAVEYNDSDIAVFTLSKISGHAASRIGWAIVGDSALAMRMSFLVTQSMSYESQAHATLLLEHIIATQGKVLDYGSKLMTGRWQRLQSIFASSDRFSGQTLSEPELDAWTGRERQPAPAYLWLRCNDQQRDPDCFQTLMSGGIIGRPSASFGGGPEYVRLELLMREEDFQKMADKLQTLATS